MDPLISIYSLHTYTYMYVFPGLYLYGTDLLRNYLV